LLAPLLAGTAHAEPVTLRLLGRPGSPAQGRDGKGGAVQIAAFEASHPDIKVKVQPPSPTMRARTSSSPPSPRRCADLSWGLIDGWAS